MSALLEVQALTFREMRRNLRSGKGVILANLAFLVGATVAYGIVKFNEMQRERLGPLSAEQHERLRAAFYENFFDLPTAKLLSPAPIELALLVWILVFTCPLLVALLGFDGVSGDLQYRTVRYFSPRVRRSSFYLSKTLGLFAVVSLILLVIGSLGWTIIVSSDAAPLGVTVYWGLRFWATTLPVVLAWTSVGVLVASLFRTPVLSLLTTLVAFFAMWLVGAVIARAYGWKWLGWIYPGAFARSLVSANPNEVVLGLVGTLAIAGLSTALGAYLLNRRDL